MILAGPKIRPLPEALYRDGQREVKWVVVTLIVPFSLVYHIQAEPRQVIMAADIVHDLPPKKEQVSEVPIFYVYLPCPR